MPPAPLTIPTPNLETNAMDKIKITTPRGRRLTFTRSAVGSVEAVGEIGAFADADIDTIHARLRALPICDDDSIAEVRNAFAEECAEGCESDADREGWAEYASAICHYAEGPDDVGGAL